MKKSIKIGGSRSLSFAYGFMALLFIIFPIPFIINRSMLGLGIILPLVISMFICAFMIVILVQNEIGLRRMNIALQGRKAFGVVKESYMSGGRRSIYHLVIAYTNDNNEECEAHIIPPTKMMSKFVEGKRVPIRVNGLYAYYDLDELLKKQDNSYIRYCPMCGKELDDEDRFCKACGHKL